MTQRILIVDDEPDTQQMLGQYLQARGYSVAFADNGWEALLELDKSGFDLILLDIMMPGLDGAKFMAVLRNYARRGYTPVVIVTALTQEEAVDRLQPHLPEGIVEKRGEAFFKDLIDRVQRVLGTPGAAGA